MKFVLALLLTSAAFGQEWTPRVTNSRFETRAASGDLAAQIQAANATWFGYAIRSAGNSDSCCWQNGSSSCGCMLEESRPGTVKNGLPANAKVPLEAAPAVTILFRVSNNKVEKVRVYSLNCSLDAGGLPFVWITGVSSANSLQFLQGLLPQQTGDRADSVILAIAQHDDPEADKVLARLAQAPQPEKFREKAIFWMGAGRGAAAIPTLKSILASDASENLRDKAVFALSISKAPEALPSLIQAARNDPAPHVRGQALFWLAQKAGKQASGEIANAIENDPDTGVKKSAVFALSQLPKDEGVPKLIEVARNQRNPEVRKQAFFWLGQSGDPRALNFIEQVVLK